MFISLSICLCLLDAFVTSLYMMHFPVSFLYKLADIVEVSIVLPSASKDCFPVHVWFVSIYQCCKNKYIQLVS